MFEGLLLHPKLEKQLASIIARPPHGLLLAGPAGSGKQTLSNVLVANILKLKPDKLELYPYVLFIDPLGDSISIEEIRSLQQFLKLKVPGRGDEVNRAIIISRAERMRREAQNALLKLLEEPPAGTMIVLTASTSDSLLPTIVSRVNVVTVLPVSFDQASEYYKEEPQKAVRQSHALSQGQPGLMHALLNDAEHPLISQVSLAKQLFSQPARDRLLMTDELSKDKPAVIMLLGAMQRICHAALTVSAENAKAPAVRNWFDRQASVLKAAESIKHNPNLKLLLDNLFLSI